jgi:hypothetical protein
MSRYHTLLSLLATVSASEAEAAQPASACQAAEHRQFDFWLGEWTVTGGPDGSTPQGRNTIARASSGCALLEHWRSTRGTEGMSLNAWDATRKEWTQFWIGGDGTLLHLRGGLVGEAMVMQGELPKADGGTQRQRITWTPKPDGSVEQRWEVSDDDGGTWSISFLGYYRRAAES